MDSSRLRTGEIVAGIGGLALFVFLFFDWFGGGGDLTGSPGNLTLSSTGISGWDALTDLPGFLIILSGVSGIALAVLAAAGQRLAITVGALMALAEDGFEGLVAVPGGRTRTAPASAPPTTPSPRPAPPRRLLRRRRRAAPARAARSPAPRRSTAAV